MDPSGGAGRGTVWVFGCGGAERPETRFEIAFPESVSEKPITGRLFLAVSPDEDPEPRIAAYNSARSLQVYHPDFFGGTWTFYPDPVDFRQYQLINIYEDDNAFVVPGASRGAPERMFQRRPDGQPVATVRQVSQMEHASGTRGRSGAQVDIWSATYGPVEVPDYAATVQKQKAELPRFRDRLDALDPSEWSVHAKIDYLLLRSEMDRLEFDLYVWRQTSRNPSFYVNQAIRNVGQLLTGGRYMRGDVMPYSKERAQRILEA